MPATSRYLTPWNYHVLDINDLRGRGILAGGKSLIVTRTWGGQDSGTMIARAANDVIAVSVGDRREIVRVTYTAQRLGGRRAWMRCPRCERQVGKLYGSPFRCRTCSRVTYPSQRTDAAGRAHRRANKLRSRLGDNGALFDDAPEKPKGMWWRTYERKMQQFNEAEDLADQHLAASFMRTFRRIRR